MPRLLASLLIVIGLAAFAVPAHAETVTRSPGQRSLNGRVLVIEAGVQLMKKNQQIFVTGIASGSPAERAGLLVGDEIRAVDGWRVYSSASVDIVLKKLRGKVDTTAEVEVGRPQKGAIIFTLTRPKPAQQPDLRLRMEGTVLVARISRMSDDAALKLREFAKNQLRQPTGVVIDLRENPGGTMSGVHDLLAALLPRNTAYASFEVIKPAFGVPVGLTKLSTTVGTSMPSSIPIVFLVTKGCPLAVAVPVAGAKIAYPLRVTVVEDTSSYGSYRDPELLMRTPEGEKNVALIGNFLARFTEERAYLDNTLVSFFAKSSVVPVGASPDPAMARALYFVR